MPAEIERRSQLLLNAAGHGRGFGAVVNSIQQDREFIATQAGHDVGFANAAFQTPGHGNQQLITDRMTQTVVDVLKTIEVKKEYSKLIVLLVFGALNHELEVFSQERAVR